MKVNNWKVYDLADSIKAAKYPMAASVDDASYGINDRVVKLAQSDKGEGHDNFLVGIRVAFDLTCSNKMWVEAERYHFFDIVSSQSTMHRLHKMKLDERYVKYVDPRIIAVMNELQCAYQEDPSYENRMRLLYSNPAGFELTARVTTNYRQLKTIYSQRKNHSLPEWRAFCRWIELLPASYLITGKETNDTIQGGK